MENKIRLKPIFNIKPTTYIPIFYLTLLIIILFSITLLPGLINRGSFVNIYSSPSGASVYIDGVRVGTTPLKMFIKNGDRDFVIKKSNFSDEYFSLGIKGDIFFTLFHKDLISHHSILKSNNGFKILDEAYKDMAEWSLIDQNQINERFRLPPLLSNATIDYYYSNDFKKETLDDFIYSAYKLVTNETILSDYINSLSISVSDNRLPSISSIKKSALVINNIVEKSPSSPLLLYNQILRNKNISINNDLYQALNDEHRKQINRYVTSYEEPSSNRTIGNMNFINVPESNIIPIDVNYIHSINEEEFYILENLLPKDEYYKFLDDRPYWRKENSDRLISAGLVDKYYLDFSNNEDYITNISFYAASAWCDWANETYNIPDGWKITLPTENKWYSALQFNIIKDNVAWQWTEQGFYFFDHYLADVNGSFIEPFSEINPRVVVGKNKYNNKIESGRGVQNSNWSTPFLSFRPILVKE